jgi:predicted nucleotidyltransferase
MSSVINRLYEGELINPPSFLPDAIQFEVMMGSEAYGVSSNDSDIDIYGFAIPPKEMVFPHIIGQIQGFGRQIQRFEQYQQHHIKDSNNGKEYDFTIYSIVKYFQLCMDNNPNMIDSLFVPERCIFYMTDIGKMVYENRKMFLHKGCYFKFAGYAHSQLKKCKNRNPQGKRKELVDKYGFDTKFAYNIPRLLLECEQILEKGDINLEVNREYLKDIRRGRYSLEEIEEWQKIKEKHLTDLYAKSKLRHSPDEPAIKQLLMNCLEEYYGSIDHIVKNDNYYSLKNDLKQLIKKYRI